jgi:hypothetical protein
MVGGRSVRWHSTLGKLTLAAYRIYTQICVRESMRKTIDEISGLNRNDDLPDLTILRRLSELLQAVQKK